LKWYKRLYVGDSLTGKEDKVIRKIRQNALQPGVYVIVLADNGKDNFRIISSLELLQKGYPKEDLTVIGIAKGKEEAFLLVGKIIQDIYDQTGAVDQVSAFFSTLGGDKRHDGGN
jgi:hypothetical protein